MIRKLLINKSLLCFILLLLFASFKVQGNELAYNFEIINKEFDDIAAQLNRKDFLHQLKPEDSILINRLNKIAYATHNNQLKARYILWEVRCNQLSIPPSKCIKMLKEAKSLSTNKYRYDNAYIDYQLAGNNERLGHYFTTYMLLQNAIPVFEEYKDHYALGNAQLLMALLFNDISDMNTALERLGISKQQYIQAGYQLNRIYFFEAVMNDNLSVHAHISLYRKAIELGGNDFGTTIQAYINLTSCYMEENKIDSAMAYIEKGKEMQRKYAQHNNLLKSILLVNEAIANYNQGEYPKALHILDYIEKLSFNYRDETYITEVYKYMSMTYHKMGNLSKAYKYLKLYQEHFEQHIKEIEQQNIQKARVRHSISKQKDIINKLKEKEILHRNFIYIILLSSTVIITFILAFAVYLYQRKRILNIKNRKLQTNLNQEMIISQLNKKRFEEDMKQKECTISSSVLLLANKNDILQKINEITSKYYDEGQIPRDYVNQINEVIEDSLRNDDEWSQFKIHFDSVHPDFFRKLKEASDELTENDLRLCAYIRIGMRAKQIAEMLAVSPDSVNSNRYRLRKKLNLERKDSLDDFIRKI